jgi:hypothetical protein
MSSLNQIDIKPVGFVPNSRSEKSGLGCLAEELAWGGWDSSYTGQATLNEFHSQHRFQFENRPARSTPP